MKPTIPLALAALTTLAASCKKDDGETPQPPPSATATTPYKDSVFTTYFRRTSGLVAADGAVSTPLSNGKSLWLFGDSYLDGFDAATGTMPCLFQARNAGLLLPISDPATGAQTLAGSGSPRSYFTFGGSNNYWFWPGAGSSAATRRTSFWSASASPAAVA